MAQKVWRMDTRICEKRLDFQAVDWSDCAHCLTEDSVNLCVRSGIYGCHIVPGRMNDGRWEAPSNQLPNRLLGPITPLDIP